MQGVFYLSTPYLPTYTCINTHYTVEPVCMRTRFQTLPLVGPLCSTRSHVQKNDYTFRHIFLVPRAPISCYGLKPPSTTGFSRRARCPDPLHLPHGALPSLCRRRVAGGAHTPRLLHPPQATSNQEDNNPATPNIPLIPVSTLFYGGMVCISAIVGKDYDVWGQLSSPLRLEETVPYFLIMGAVLAGTTAFAEKIPGLQQLKKLYQKDLIPQLQPIPLWGLAVMACGAGVGEEALFRALIQTWLIEHAAGFVPGNAPDIAVGAGVFFSSVIFGALHAATPSYFIFATFAGAIFGIEYIQLGLPAAAFTHALYDLVAFVVVIQLWGEKSGQKKIDS